MTKKVLLKRYYIFNPSETGWTRIYEYDNQYAKFLDSIGLQAFKFDVFGDPSEAIIEITKKPDAINLSPNPVGRPKTVKGIIKTFSRKDMKAPEREFKKGAFLPRKGYLKK